MVDLQVNYVGSKSSFMWKIEFIRLDFKHLLYPTNIDSDQLYTLVIFTANFVSRDMVNRSTWTHYKKNAVVYFSQDAFQNLYSIQQYCPINTVFLYIPFIVMPVARFKTRFKTASQWSRVLNVKWQVKKCTIPLTNSFSKLEFTELISSSPLNQNAGRSPLVERSGRTSDHTIM